MNQPSLARDFAATVSRASTGRLCRSAALLASMGWATTAIAAPVIDVLYQFGAAPDGNLAAFTTVTPTSTGEVFGVAEYGGTGTNPYCDSSFGTRCGTLFKIGADGHETTLRNFGVKRMDGNNPFSPVLVDAAGNLYGTLSTGGKFNQGAIYKYDAGGHYDIVHKFAGGASDGAAPVGNLAQDAEGNVYGLAGYGGKGSCRFGDDIVGCGTVWKIDAAGKYSTVYELPAFAQGYYPQSLAFDQGGNMIVTTGGGGAHVSADCPDGCGVVFKIDRDGQGTVLHDFEHGSDGAFPGGPVVWDRAGNLYGTAAAGGTGNGAGVIWKISPKGKFSTAHAFSGLDGAAPAPAVAMDQSGKLFGTTWYGGNTSCQGAGCGVVWQFDTASGELGVLYAFESFTGTTGYWPYAGVAMDATGNLFGVSHDGYSDAGRKHGTVWRLKP